MITTDERIAAARRQLAEVEADMLQALARVRALLVIVEEENRELRREALERKTEFYTEREVGAVLKVSYSTVTRLRKAGRLPYLQVGGQIRYTSVQLAQVGEIFGKPEVKSQSSKVTGRLRRVS